MKHAVALSLGLVIGGLGLLAARSAVAAPVPAAEAAAKATPSAEELLTAMDGNLQFETRTAVIQMDVSDGRRTRSYEMISFGRGESDSAIEYRSPEREKGTRMLKLGDQLWMYMPRAERTQKISGHMMRQGMMGSDVSYEDMMTGSDFAQQYDAVVLGSEVVDGRLHWKVEAKAKDTTVTYPRRLIWIDDGYRIPTKQELFALSGMLMKTWTMSDVQNVEGQMMPMRMEIRDALREGSSTVIVTTELKLGVALEDEVFSKRWLERSQ